MNEIDKGLIDSIPKTNSQALFWGFIAVIALIFLVAGYLFFPEIFGKKKDE